MPARTIGVLLITCVLGQAAVPAASAQQPSQDSSPPAAPQAQPSKPICPPDVGPNAPTVGSGQRGNLSDQLAESNGVICPPASADHEMAVPPKDTGRMPVIPPPGTPGGDQRIQPK